MLNQLEHNNHQRCLNQLRQQPSTTCVRLDYASPPESPERPELTPVGGRMCAGL